MVDYKEKGYSEAEVEILLKIERLTGLVDVVVKSYVKREEFEPVQRLVYGLVGVILMAVVVALIALVLQ